MTKKTKKTIDIEEGTFSKCAKCQEIILTKTFEENLWICPKCGYYKRLTAREKIRTMIDAGSFEELYPELRSNDPLKFTDTEPYAARLEKTICKTGLNDAVICGRGTLDGIQVAVGAMDFEFMGGSMGYVVGEKLVRTGERAMEDKIPLIIISSSGGARMQEGIISLMQMAKTSAMAGKMKEAGLPYISVLHDPTTGGVTASFAMLGDVIISEPKALIGFAGPRVIEQTIKQTLPDGFQRAEFLLEHGMLDMIVKRENMKKTVARILRILLNK